MFKFESLLSFFQAWDSHSSKCQCTGVRPNKFFGFVNFSFSDFFYTAKTGKANMQQVRKYYEQQQQV
jgi:hypothetical protein